jgi:hypothetical protein
MNMGRMGGKTPKGSLALHLEPHTRQGLETEAYA